VLLLAGAALAAPDAPLCTALLAERTDVAGALQAIASGADVSARCTHEVTVHVRRTPTLAEVLLGIVVPPIGVMMVLGNEPQPRQRTRHPAPLDLAVDRELGGLVDALLEAGADPLQPAPPGQPVPLVTAIAKDLALGGTRWTDRLLSACDHVPAGLLRSSPGSLDALLEHPDILRPLLAAGLDPEGRDERDQTWLTRAAQQGRPDRARAALALGADPDLRVGGRTPLAAAVSRGDLEMMALLVEAGARPLAAAGTGDGLATLAVASGDPAVLDAVLAMGAPLDGGDGQGRAPITVAADRGPPELLERLLERGARPTDAAVLAATKRGDAAAVGLLLDAGGDANAEGPFGRRPLHHALRAGDEALIAALLAGGADPGRRASSAVFDEPPPIRIPLDAGDVARVRSLLPRVAPAERAWLLGSALARADEDMAEAILETGVDLDAVLVRADSAAEAGARAWLRARGARVPADALADVVAYGCLEAVEEALADGAAVDVPGGEPARLPAEVALERGEPGILEVLLQAGARVSPEHPADRYLRDATADVLDTALRMGATADAGTIREAVFWHKPDHLEVLARHVHDPRAWEPRSVGLGRLQERAAEIHAEKVERDRARRKAERAERRAARRARRGR
jgi:ankyrin repeat protein